MMWTVPGKAVDTAPFAALRPAKILYDFDGPMSFTFHDQSGELFLAHWCDEDGEVTRFIAVPFSNRLLDKLEHGEISLREALEQPRAWVLDEDRQGKVVAAWRVEIGELPHDVLPKSGALLTAALERTRRPLPTSS